MGLKQIWDRITGGSTDDAPEPADTTADSFELRINGDDPGGGTTYPTIQEAKAAGYAAIQPAGSDGTPDGDAYFTVHRIDSDGRETALAFNSNQAGAGA